MKQHVWLSQDIRDVTEESKELHMTTALSSLVRHGQIELGRKYVIEIESDTASLEGDGGESVELVRYHAMLDDFVEPKPGTKVAYFCDGKACYDCHSVKLLKQFGSAATCLRTFNIKYARNFAYDPISDTASEIIPGIDITDKAVKHYGKFAQIDMAVEEMAELIVALKHHQRRKAEVEEIIEEIADVEIMLMQLKTIYECWSDVDIVKDEKLERLSKRMEETETFCDKRLVINEEGED